MLCFLGRSSEQGEASVKKVLQRDDLGEGRARAYWHALGAVHGSTGLAASIPNMPCTVTVSSELDEDEEGSVLKAGRPQPALRPSTQEATAPSNPPSSQSFEFEFKGAPRPMLPLLKEMVRFERPYITWDIWNDPPPLAFPATAGPDATAADSGTPQDGLRDAAHPPLRDPRVVNNVRHLGNAKQWDADQRQLAAEDWVGSTSDSALPQQAKAVKPIKDGLYIVHLVPPDGELALGLVRIMSTTVVHRDVEDEETSVPHYEAAWFQRTPCSKAPFTWSANPTFKWWPKPKGKSVKEHHSSWVRADSLLVQVKPSDLTGASRDDEVRLVSPRLCKPFMEKLKAMAAQRSLIGEKGEEADDGEDDNEEEDCEGSEEDSEEDEEEDQEDEGEDQEDEDEELAAYEDNDESREFQWDEEHRRAEATAAATSSPQPHTTEVQDYTAPPLDDFEVQGCDASCMVPCMNGCGWDRCTLLMKEEKHWTVRMHDNGGEIRVLKHHVRSVAEASRISTSVDGRRPKRHRASSSTAPDS
jgi:hypothetical protein